MSIERKQIIEWAGAAVIGAAALGIYTWVTDRMVQGDAAIAATAINAEIDKALLMDSGDTVQQAILKNREVALENSVKLDIVIQSLEALSSE